MNRYAEAIAILMAPGCDRHELLIRVAQLNPAAIVRAHKGVTPPWMKDVDMYIRNGERITAIKLWREKTDTNLREAKEAVDKRQQELGL